MKIIRNDSESLVCQNSMPLSTIIGAPVIFGGQAVFIGAIALWAHAPILWVGSLVAVAGLAMFFHLAPTATTFAFARDSRRFMVIRKYVARQTREVFDFDQVQGVELKPISYLVEALSIVLAGGRKISVSAYNPVQKDQKRHDAQLLREALELPEPELLQNAAGYIERRCCNV